MVLEGKKSIGGSMHQGKMLRNYLFNNIKTENLFHRIKFTSLTSSTAQYAFVGRIINSLKVGKHMSKIGNSIEILIKK